MKQQIRLGMLCGGADFAIWPGGLVSSRHTADDVEQTLSAFENLLSMQ